MFKIDINQVLGLIAIMTFLGTTLYWILFYKLRSDFPTKEHLQDNYLSWNSARVEYVPQKILDTHIDYMTQTLGRLEKSVESIRKQLMDKSA